MESRQINMEDAEMQNRTKQILIGNRWMEQPPQSMDSRELVKA
jgi:hypothetical protein